MPPEFQSGSPADWLRRANSDLALACGRLRRGVLTEDLCFHAQQAVEKSLKAVLISKGIEFPRTHNLRMLIDALPENVFCDPILDSSAALTDYAVSARYPGEVEEVTRQELKTARHIAREVVAWAENITRI
jgi:HEPN domain-containing protein